MSLGNDENLVQVNVSDRMSWEGWKKLIWDAMSDPKKRRVAIAGISVVGLSILMKKSAGLASKTRQNAAVDKMVEEIVSKRLPFSEFLQKIENSEVDKAFVGSRVIEFLLKGDKNTNYFTHPILYHPGVLEMLHDKKIPFDDIDLNPLVSGGKGGGSAVPAPQRPLRSFLMFFVPVVYFSLCAYVIKMLYDQTSGGDVGTLSNEKKNTSSGPAIARTTFDDVAGINAAREVVEEVADFLKNPERYTRVGARLPTGILLVGPPGTGKTMLARAMANECGLAFFYCSGSDFVEIYAGRGASRVRNLFAKAAKSAPCVIFFDEIDALGKSRSADFSMNEEREQTLNQLLATMDGFCSEKRIVIMAATNRYDVLDKALVRPGRFDRIVHVSLPDQDGREAILKVHTRHMNLAEDCDLRMVSSLCPEYTGAELSMIVNEAAIRAARDKRDELYTDDFIVAIQTYKNTTKNKTKMNRSGSDFIGQMFGGLN